MANQRVQLQTDIVAKLLSEDLLQNVNVVALRELQLSSSVESKRVWLQKRNEKSGVGILVGMPTISYENGNAPGPTRKLMTPISVFEQPSINSLASTGTQLECEEITDRIDAVLSRFQMERLAGIYPEGVVPNLATEAGVIREDHIYAATMSRLMLLPVPMPTAGAVGTLVTLTNAAGFETASIFYTTDGSFPQRNPVTGLAAGTAVKYTVPFNAAIGTAIRWAAWLANYSGSDVGYAVVT
jgi:hypothetical protein